jgi:glutathione S-transferase
MSHADTVTLYHGPSTRSTGVLVLLEELGAPYRLEVLNLKSGETRAPAFLAVNPMGKVPALVHRGALVTEQPAIYLYLADEFPAAGLAPPIGDALRGPYLRWLVYYAASFEPAVLDRALRREPGPPGTVPYGDFDTMLGVVVTQLAAGPWFLGERFTACDVLWGSALTWTTGFGIVPRSPPVEAYVERFNARPAVAKVRALDESLGARQSAEQAK